MPLLTTSIVPLHVHSFATLIHVGLIVFRKTSVRIRIITDVLMDIREHWVGAVARLNLQL